MIKSKKVQIEGKDIIIYDNVFSQQELYEIYLHINNRPYVRHNLDDVLYHNKQADVKWSSEITDGEILFDILMSKYSSNIIELQFQNFTIIRSYVNFAAHGTLDLIHDDAPHYKKNHWTLLQYGNFKWDSNWHGETVFYDSNFSEILFSTTMQPGRIVLFDSTIPHSARPPSKLAQYPRYTIAFKLSMIEKELQ